MLSADPCSNHVIALDGAVNVTGFLGSDRALRITSWSPSILVWSLAADDVGHGLPVVRLTSSENAQEQTLDAIYIVERRTVSR
jgi:hypothetical protein